MKVLVSRVFLLNSLILLKVVSTQQVPNPNVTPQVVTSVEASYALVTSLTI